MMLEQARLDKILLWDQIITADPAPWKLAMADAAHGWARYLDLTSRAAR